MFTTFIVIVVAIILVLALVYATRTKHPKPPTLEGLNRFAVSAPVHHDFATFEPEVMEPKRRAKVRLRKPKSTRKIIAKVPVQPGRRRVGSFPE